MAAQEPVQKKNKTKWVHQNRKDAEKFRGGETRQKLAIEAGTERKKERKDGRREGIIYIYIYIYYVSSYEV